MSAGDDERERVIVDWYELEPGIRDTLGELSRLFRRAAKRKWLVLFICVSVTALLVVRSARKETNYGARVQLLVTESSVEAESRETERGSRIHTNDKLRDFIVNAAFTDGKVIEVFKKNKHRERDIENNPRLVLQSFREDVEVEISHNHFLEEPSGTPRTANISVGIMMQDPDKALAIARSLGDLVVERDSAYRKEAYEAARSIAGYQLKLVNDRIDETQSALADARTRGQFATTRGEEANWRMKTLALGGRLEGLSYELTAARNRYEEVRMMDNAGAMGLRFERIDWGAAEMRVDKKGAVIRFGIVVLLMSIPFVAMGVGGFDRRVYDSGDVRRLGLVPLGTVRATQPRVAGPTSTGRT